MKKSSYIYLIVLYLIDVVGLILFLINFSIFDLRHVIALSLILVFNIFLHLSAVSRSTRSRNETIYADDNPLAFWFVLTTWTIILMFMFVALVFFQPILK